jgi:Mg-chelatase subunit ChlD
MKAWARATTSLFLLLFTALNLTSPSFPHAPTPLAPRPVRAQGGGTIRTAYLYSEDTSTAQAFETLLESNGFDVTLMQVAAPEWPFHVYLPLILRSFGGSATSAAPSPAALPDLAGYDLVVVGADTGLGSIWVPEPGFATALQESGLPIAGIGVGGHALFGELGLDIGYPHGQSASTDTVRVADFGASQLFYVQPNTIAVPESKVLTLYNAPQDTIVIPLDEHLVDGVRVASLPDATNQFPIVASEDRYLLWGPSGAPDAMTSTGEELLINALYYLVGELVLPIKGAEGVPPAGFEPAFLDELSTASEPRHGFAQLDHIPSQAERQTLASKGVTLQSYLGGTFYAVLVDPAFDPDDPFLQSMIRWLGDAAPSLKVDPSLTGGSGPALAQIDTALVAFFDDVTVQEAEAILSSYTNEFSYYANQTWEIPLDTTLIENLAQGEDVRWISPGPPPPQDTNDTARALIGTNAVQDAVIPTTGAATYLGLDGSGVMIGHFERKADATHLDLSGRVTAGGSASANQSDHATHVAGIMIGSGADSSNQGGTNRQWRGHAPGASLVSESYANGVDDFADAVLNYGVELSNHSYVMTYGTYDGVATAVDNVVRGDATDSNGDDLPPHLAVWAAANQGAWAQYNNEEGFYSIYSPAKNSLTVGSVDSNDGELSMFSSKGPTFDGRIKPDVMAPGSRAWNASVNSGNPTTGIQSTSLGGGYVGKSGTSMAAPATTGVLALMLEQYHKSYGTGSTPRPSTLKALLVNTADDMVHTASDGSDDNDPDLCRAEGTGGTPLDWSDPLDADCWIPYGPGPDYATGYGLINAVNAVAAVRGGMFLEDTLSPSVTTKTWTLTIPSGRDELRFTLAWDDEAGSSSAPATSAQLVNDLDLRLIGPDSSVHLPFTLDPLPAAASLGGGALDPIDQSDISDAYQGDDDRNNVEQVLVENPMPGTWTVEVTIEGGFPTGDPQPFSLVGDARALNIVDPQTGDVAEAGDPADPNVILVVVEANDTLSSKTSTLVDAEVGDFGVTIGGTAADIVSGNAVGDQFWLNVRPQSGVYSAGNKYALTVAMNGYGEDTENNAILFTAREVADRAVVIDTSGSMNDYGKMAAAQNAARLFIDQSLAGDRIAVVEFDTTATTPYTITQVSADPSTPELDAAKTVVDGLLPGNLTAIGQGLLAGQDQVTAPPADFSVADVLILLSDGMENVAPKYETPAVKGVIEPTDTIIHTVAVGPSSSGHHGLLDTIAGDNGGASYHVDTSGSTTAAAGTVLAAGTGVDAWPQSLPNRLGDVYKQIAEDVLGENRLYQFTDLADPKMGTYTDTLQVPAGLKRLTVALNWEIPNHLLQLVVTDPNGTTYQHDPQVPNRFCRDDATHQTCIIENPRGGTWKMTVQFLETTRENEYALWASARTAVDFRLFVGTPGRERAPGEPVLLLGYLHESGKPLGSRTVTVKVFGPLGEATATVKLEDDGNHGDGQPDDGIYGGYLLATDAIGMYAARGQAQGNDSAGDPFVLYDNATFDVRPRVLYVYDSDATTALRYERLLEENSRVVDLSVKGAVPSLELSKYNLAVIGPDTGSLGTWTPQATVDALTQYEVPVLGLGEGGYAYFGVLGLDIGYANGAHGSGTSIIWNRVTVTDTIWRYPYEFSLPKEALQLYEADSSRVDIYLGDQPLGVTIFGYNDADQTYADLIMDEGYWMLWSFDDGPDAMTETGRELFVNTAYRTLR